MKRHFSYLLWLAFSVGFILLFAFDGKADDIRLFYANNSAWKTDRVIVAPNGATLPAQQLYPSQFIPVGGSQLVENFGASGFGVQTISVTGDVRAWTEASFNDGKDTNSVEIPPLPAPLDPSSGIYQFAGIENIQRGRATFFALVSDKLAHVIFEVFDGANHKIATESLDVSGFAFYPLRTLVLLGRVEMRVGGGFNFGWPTDGKVYAVAFVGRDSGKPRVEVPTLR